ncbi:hypothetical protein DPMN_179822 [Dreissena polymorpha]|uniref:Uncharacterized protein n=1 Tax=Dreissena polymorpha TaxID=45954 RepID=A0A9D4EHY0_DREPO|nr:hypothetical protein DPMN_179822 [Dreissena polymorpha]
MSLKRKIATPLGSHVFQAKWPLRVLTRKNAPPPGGHIRQMWPLVKNAPPLGSHVFQANKSIFKLIQDIIETNLLTKFHESLSDIIGMILLTKKNAPPLGSHVFQANKSIFKLIQDIIETNLLTKFHEDWTRNVASRE